MANQLAAEFERAKIITWQFCPALLFSLLFIWRSYFRIILVLLSNEAFFPSVIKVFVYLTGSRERERTRYMFTQYDCYKDWAVIMGEWVVEYFSYLQFSQSMIVVCQTVGICDKICITWDTKKFKARPRISLLTRLFSERDLSRDIWGKRKVNITYFPVSDKAIGLSNRYHAYRNFLRYVRF